MIAAMAPRSPSSQPTATTAEPGPSGRARPGVEVQRRRVLEAAWRVIGRLGLERARVEDVLAEAGVSRQTFYRCYASLDDAFRAVRGEVEGFLREAVLRGLAAAQDAPDTWLRGLLEAVFEAAVAAGPALAAIEREETRPGSPFEGARAERQARLAELVLASFRARHDLEADPWQVRAVIMAVNQLCVAVCDPARAGPDDVARAREAAWSLAQGLLLHEGWRAGRWDVVPRDPAAPLPPRPEAHATEARAAQARAADPDRPETSRPETSRPETSRPETSRRTP